ncbi:MAG TPA: hypothetical protein PKA39_07870 [Ignavibacteria bacterium]|nr:hypothetical protein [Ignavibacteria bacterium]
MTKNNMLLRLLPLAAIGALVFLSSCWFLDPASELFRIQIDSSFAPSSVTYDHDSVTLKLWGKIGDDTCHSFSHFQVYQDSSNLDLTAWGFFNPAYRKFCPEADVQLAGKEYKIWPLKRGTFAITIRQPDGTFFKRFVQVN